MSILSRLNSFFFKQIPNAAKAWSAAEGDAQHAYWLYATPVNLLVGRDSFFLSESSQLAITGDEALSIVTSLNQYFSGLGYYFYVRNNTWFLGLDVDPRITTTPIEEVFNKDITPYLPSGEGGLAWAKLQNEIQMLLFNHPVNELREQQGNPVINSLWFYGLSAAV